MKAKCGSRIVRGEQGMSLVEVALVLPLLFLLLVGIIDFGRAFYLSNEVAGAAHAGAVYGSQYPSDTAGMQAAATKDAPDVAGITASASYGCECPDGSGASVGCSSVPSCSANLVYYVKVTTSVSYLPLIQWPGIPSPLTLRDTVEMRSGGSGAP